MNVEGYTLGMGQVSYNQAYFQMIRLHEAMREINLCWTNLAAATNGVPNYQILFDNLVAFYMEARPSFLTRHKDAVDKKLEEAEKYIYNNPLWKPLKKFSVGGSRTEYTLDGTVYYEIRKQLRELQSLILDYAEERGLLNPKKSDPTQAVVN